MDEKTTAAAANAQDAVTIITSTRPQTVCKRYTLGDDGQLVKTSVANIWEGMAQCQDVPDVDAMVALLREVTQRQDQAIVSGRWHGCTGQAFRIVTEKALAEMLGKDMGDADLGGVLEHDGELVAARLKRGIDPAAWVLFDADNPPGMPEEWAALTIQQRLDLWEALLPGVSKVERIELRGSSARVHCVDEEPGPVSHAWLQVDDPSAIERMRSRLQVEMVTQDLAFASPRTSRLEPGKVIGHEARTLFDLAVFVVGRLAFCAQPNVEPAGYSVADADIQVVNRGGGKLRIGHLALPNAAALKAYERKTGIALGFSKSKNSLGVTSVGLLTPDTEITVRGTTRRLGEWLAQMTPGDKLRCEAPFRASQSEAAVIVKNDDGSAIVHDIGIGTTYVMDAPPPEKPAPAKPCTLDKAHEVFRRWLGQDYDIDTLNAVLAASAAERLPGDPPWLLIISGAGNAKTETVQATSRLGAHVVSTISSDGALLSASPRRQRARTATGGLLRQIGERGILVIKDVTSILSADRNIRAAILAALREIHDGQWVRHVGSDGGQTLSWKGRIVVIGACTTAWDTHHAVIATMGDRFVLVRSDSHVGRNASALRAMRNTGQEAAMRQEMADAAAGVVEGMSTKLYKLTEQDEAAIAQAADIVALARTAVEMDYRGEVIFAHDPEMPTRLGKQLTQIMRGAIAIAMTHEAALKLVLRCARDCIPPLRLAVLRDIAANPNSRVPDVRQRLQKPRATIDRTLQALHYLGLLVCNETPTERGGKTVQVRSYYLTAENAKAVAALDATPGS